PFGNGARRQRHPDETRGTNSVVEILIPFVAERFVWKKHDTRRQVGHPRIAPEAQRAHRHGYFDLTAAAVDSPDLARECVFRATAISRRAESCIAPRARGYRIRARVERIQRVIVDVVPHRLLVADEGAERRHGAVDARLPARLPEHLVAAEERQIHAGIARLLDAGALVARPVLVVPDRAKDLRLVEDADSGDQQTCVTY